MSFIENIDCELCGGKKSVSVYEGWSKCFSISGGKACGYRTGTPEEEYMEYLPIVDRGINMATCKHFSYSADTNGVHKWALVSLDGQKVQGHKKRLVDADGEKTFSSTGKAIKHLWGMNKANERSKMVIIAEGEIDCMSMSQAFENKWAVVSLPNGVTSAKASIGVSAPWLEKFEKIVLMYDNDEAGDLARRETISQLSPGKVHVVSYPEGCNDANEVLLKHETQALVTMAYGAKQYRPDAVVTGEDLREHLFREILPATPYPWDGLNRMLGGIRPAEIVMLCGGSGSGKSTLSRELALALAYSQDCKVGYIALEESVQTCALRMISVREGVANLHLDQGLIEKPKLEGLCDELSEKMCFLDMAFSSTEPEELKYNIRYLVQGLGCKFVFLDHISFVISGGGAADNERQRIDVLMHSLRNLCQQLDAGFVVVSHLKRPFKGQSFEEGRKPMMSDLRGSASLEQLSDVVIGASRNMRAEDPVERNTVTIEVLKNRPMSQLGDALQLKYDENTGKMDALDEFTDFTQVFDAN